MAVFDWRIFEETGLTLPPLEQRFASAEGAEGIEEWRKLVRELRELAGRQETPEVLAAIGDAFDRFLQAVDSVARISTRPTVFVSHQRADACKAERIAWQATEVGFDYWLDIHDPLLSFANSASTATPIRAVLIAAIIEIGLLNSSHIVAIQTKASLASHWVPYEFGRAKHRHVFATQAASWFETGVVPDPGGDYLSLGLCALSEADLVKWLNRQPGARRRPNTIWRRPYIPPDLPN
jgi:hypothetical protein